MEWVPYTTRCECRCHQYSGVVNEPSVDVSDPLHAVLACDACRNYHAPALRDPAPPEPPPPASFCYEDPTDAD